MIIKLSSLCGSTDEAIYRARTLAMGMCAEVIDRWTVAIKFRSVRLDVGGNGNGGNVFVSPAFVMELVS